MQVINLTSTTVILSVYASNLLAILVQGQVAGIVENVELRSYITLLQVTHAIFIRLTLYYLWPLGSDRRSRLLVRSTLNCRKTLFCRTSWIGRSITMWGCFEACNFTNYLISNWALCRSSLIRVSLRNSRGCCWNWKCV